MAKRYTKYRKPMAFTLVELLVVVAIIALLIAILIPTLRSAKERANSGKCKNNCKAQSTGLQQYINESKEWLPPTRVLFYPPTDKDPAGGGSTHSWYSQYWADLIVKFCDASVTPKATSIFSVAMIRGDSNLGREIGMDYTVVPPKQYDFTNNIVHSRVFDCPTIARPVKFVDGLSNGSENTAGGAVWTELFEYRANLGCTVSYYTSGLKGPWPWRAAASDVVNWPGGNPLGTSYTNPVCYDPTWSALKTMVAGDTALRLSYNPGIFPPDNPLNFLTLDRYSKPDNFTFIMEVGSKNYTHGMYQFGFTFDPRTNTYYRGTNPNGKAYNEIEQASVCAPHLGRVNAINLSGRVVDYSAEELWNYNKYKGVAETANTSNPKSRAYTEGLPFTPIENGKMGDW